MAFYFLPRKVGLDGWPEKRGDVHVLRRQKSGWVVLPNIKTGIKSLLTDGNEKRKQNTTNPIGNYYQNNTNSEYISDYQIFNVGLDDASSKSAHF